jgi:PEP-CTERM motif
MNRTLRKTLTLGAATIVLFAIIIVGAPSTKSDPLIEEAILTQNLAFYPDGSLLTNAIPDGSYQDGLLDIPYVQYSLVGVQQGSGFIIDTTTLQSVTIHAGNTLPPDGPLESFAGFDYYATVYEGDIFSGPGSEVGTTLYSNAPPPPPPTPSLYVILTETISSKSPDFFTTMQAMPTVSVGPPKALPGTVETDFISSLPSNVTTVQQAANALGYSGFRWEQTVTIPSPSPYFECTDPQCDPPGEENVVGRSADPPQYGWDYCNPHSLFKTRDFDCSTIFPYYAQFLPNSGFKDTPADPCLPGGSGAGCGGETANLGEALQFDTTLVGVYSDARPPGFVYSFDWQDGFNGTSGGVATTVNDEPVDPGSGTGGITLVSVDGVPVDVPEPSTLAVVSAGVAALGMVRRRKQFIRLFGRLT